MTAFTWSGEKKLDESSDSFPEKFEMFDYQIKTGVISKILCFFFFFFCS